MLLVKLILHSAAPEFRSLCQYHNYRDYPTALLFLPSVFIGVFPIPFSLLSLFSVYLTLILHVYLQPFLSHGTRYRRGISKPHRPLSTLCLLNKRLGGARFDLLNKRLGGARSDLLNKRLGGARSDLNTFLGRGSSSSVDNPTAMARSRSL
jgi:hypothetical protein